MIQDARSNKIKTYMTYSRKNNHEPTYKYHDDIGLELTIGEMSCFLSSVVFF
jgi:hypothetical protein